jgi:hypothetical protein
LALVELEIVGWPSNVPIIECKQPHTKYVPYDESYFDLANLQPIRHDLYKLPEIDSFRVAFYLHFYDPGQPLITPLGAVRVGPMGNVPDHLKDKEYAFWD